VTDVRAEPGLTEEPWLMSESTLRHVIAADRSRSRVVAALLSAVLLVAATGSVAAAVWLDRESYAVPAAPMLVAAAFLLVAAVVAPLTVVTLHRARKRRWERRQRECLELAGIADTIRDPALGRLISFNFRLMDRFVAVAIEQAKTSYIACSLACAAALLVLLVGTAITLTVQAVVAQVTAGALTAVGATLTSYLGMTFLRTFQMTSKQMSYYYGQPLVHCYLLHAEWLGERFEQDADATNRWEIRHQLIRAALGASHNAQNHLLDLQLGLANAAPPPTPADRHVVAPVPDGNGRRQG
jgi:hypothetical protein